MPRLVGGGIAVALLATTLTAARAPEASAPAAADLPRETARGVVVDLADGDRFEVSVSRNLREVRGRRYDAATGTWGERDGGAEEEAPLLRGRRRPRGRDVGRRDRRVRPVRLRRGPGAHPLPGPVVGRPRDLAGAPARGRGLRGAGHLPRRPLRRLAAVPGLPHADPRRGLRGPHRLALPGPGVHRDRHHRRRRPRLGPVRRQRPSGTRLPASPWSPASATSRPVRQELDVPNACSDSSLVNVDALTALFGDRTSPAYVTTISRPDQAVPVGGHRRRTGVRARSGGARRTVGTLFVSATGLPLVALSSADRQARSTCRTTTRSRSAGVPRGASSTCLGACPGRRPTPRSPSASSSRSSTATAAVAALVSTDGVDLDRRRTGSRPSGVSTDRRWVSTSTRTDHDGLLAGARSHRAAGRGRRAGATRCSRRARGRPPAHHRASVRLAHGAAGVHAVGLAAYGRRRPARAGPQRTSAARSARPVRRPPAVHLRRDGCGAPRSRSCRAGTAGRCRRTLY